ncbi:MAG: hypothetical protein NVSMB9_05680 [Isosphaeraceae bacterium]
MRRILCAMPQRALVMASFFLAFATAGAAPPPDLSTSPIPSGEARARTQPFESPLLIFLRKPEDLDRLWRSLAKPDFVILRGDEYSRLSSRVDSASADSSLPWASIVGSISIQGTVSDDLAALTTDLGVTLAVAGPVWVPVRFDGRTLTGAREGDLPLPLRTRKGGDWEIELSGKREHQVRIDLLVPLRQTSEGKRLDLAIPEAASTRVELEVPYHVSDSQTGPGEPVAGESLDATGKTRLRTVLTPRERIALTWKIAEPETTLAPLLAAQGEIAVDLDSESFRTRSAWSIRALRGTTRSLEFHLDADEEVLELEVGGQRSPPRIKRDGGETRLSISLPEPLGPDQERRLTMTTRRKIAGASPTRIAFKGFPLSNASEQSGAIGIATTGSLWVTGSAGSGVRQIDPRTELPANLRARPATELAYHFSEQPFELTLRAENSPPLVRVEARTTVLLDPGLARVDSWLDFETARGRIFELNLAIPAGLIVDSVGPSDIVGSRQTGPLPSSSIAGARRTGSRLLSLRLRPRVQEWGRFTIHLVGHQSVERSAREVAIGLFQPIGALSGGGRIALATDPSLIAELPDDSDHPLEASVFRPTPPVRSAEWPWPDGQAGTRDSTLWLRYDDSPPELPLHLTVQPSTLSEATTLSVRVDRHEAEIQQDTECSVQFGARDHLDVMIPAVLERRWTVESAGVSPSADLGRTPQGDRKVRLKLANRLSRSASFRFRYRLPLEQGLRSGSTSTLLIPWLRMAEANGASAAVQATIVAEPGLAVETAGAEWKRTADGTSGGGDESQALRLVAPSSSTRLGVLNLRVTSRELATLPRLVASHLALRTLQGIAGELRTNARYLVSTHRASFSVALPGGAELLQARVEGESVEHLEQLAGSSGLRIVFPPRFKSGPVLVELEYVIPTERVDRRWAPPRLLDDGVVQQTFWELRLPGNRAVVGVPAGWSDQNEWYWDAYVWKRRPLRTGAVLESGADTPPQRANRPPGVEIHPTLRGDYHGYLFARPGDPVDLAVTIVHRAFLVALCSGSILVLGGLLILVWRPSFQWFWIMASLLTLSTSILVLPTVTLLVLQSAWVGFLLTLLIAVMQRFVGRRRLSPLIHANPNGRTPTLGLDPAMSRADSDGVGSDDSTAIRIRSRSTIDHVRQIAPTAPDANNALSGLRKEPTRGGDAVS